MKCAVSRGTWPIGNLECQSSRTEFAQTLVNDSTALEEYGSHSPICRLEAERPKQGNPKRQRDLWRLWPDWKAEANSTTPGKNSNPSRGWKYFGKSTLQGNSNFETQQKTGKQENKKTDTQGREVEGTM